MFVLFWNTWSHLYSWKNYRPEPPRSSFFSHSKIATEETFTCAKSTVETREKNEIFSKLTKKKPERRHWRRSGVFIVYFEYIFYFFTVFLLLTLNMYLFAGKGELLNLLNLIWTFIYYAIFLCQLHIRKDLCGQVLAENILSQSAFY